MSDVEGKRFLKDYIFNCLHQIQNPNRKVQKRRNERKKLLYCEIKVILTFKMKLTLKLN